MEGKPRGRGRGPAAQDGSSIDTDAKISDVCESFTPGRPVDADVFQLFCFPPQADMRGMTALMLDDGAFR